MAYIGDAAAVCAVLFGIAAWLAEQARQVLVRIERWAFFGGALGAWSSFLYVAFTAVADRLD